MGSAGDDVSSNTSLEQVSCYRALCIRTAAKRTRCSNPRCPGVPEARLFFCGPCSASARCPVCGAPVRPEDITSVTDARTLAYASSTVSGSAAARYGDAAPGGAPLPGPGEPERLGGPQGLEGSEGAEGAPARGRTGPIYCGQCGAEGGQGARGGRGAFYCQYCWDNWNGRVSDEAAQVARQYVPKPRTVKYSRLPDVAAAGASYLAQGTEVEVVDEDCLSAAMRLAAAADSAAGCSAPCVLGMANRRTPGGAAGPAGVSQLAQLCRGTTFQAVVDKGAYPLGRRSALYVPDVIAFRAESRPVPHFRIAVLAVPAIEKPRLGSEDELAFYRADLASRARGLLRLCAEHGRLSLVLGAWGCGTNRNPPWEVAAAFKSALLGSGDGAHHFSHVVFAIAGDRAAREAFQEVWGRDAPRHQ